MAFQNHNLMLTLCLHIITERQHFLPISRILRNVPPCHARLVFGPNSSALNSLKFKISFIWF